MLPPFFPPLPRGLQPPDLVQRRIQRALGLSPTEAAMLYAKAFAVGVVTGVLAPILVAVASIVWVLVTVFFGGFAVTGGGGGGIGGVAIGLPMNISPKPLVIQKAVGFAIGFLFSLWRDLVRKHGTR